MVIIHPEGIEKSRKARNHLHHIAEAKAARPKPKPGHMYD